MKTFHEKYPNWISPYKFQAIKMSNKSWIYCGNSDVSFKRHFVLGMFDDNFLKYNFMMDSSKYIVSHILNRFYNQHL